MGRLLFVFLLLISLSFVCHAQTDPEANTADSLYQQGNFSAAAQAYHQLAEQFRGEGLYELVYEYLYWEAKSLIQQYEYAKARKILNEILSASDATIDAALLSKVYHETGYTFMGEGNIEEGLAFSEKSIHTELARANIDTFQLAKYQEFNGFLRLQSGEYEEAEKRVVNAHQLRQQILDPMDRELGYSANTLYIVLDALGKLQAADTVIGQAWHILNHHLPEEHPHIAVLANNYGTHLLDMGNPQEARAYLLRAITSNESGKRYFPLIGNYVNLGLLHLNLNESRTAEGYYRQAWEIADTLIAYPDYQRANIQDALGAAYYQQEQTDQAENWFQAAYTEKQELYERESAEIAQSIYNLGLVASAREDSLLALGYFREAAEIRKAVLGPEHPKRADALFEVGAMSWSSRKEEAIHYWKQSLEIYRKNYGLPHHHSLETILRLAEAYAELQQPDSLQLYLRMAWSSAAGQQDVHQGILNTDSLILRQYNPFVLDLINLHLRICLQQGTPLDLETSEQAYLVLKAAQEWLPDFQALFNDAALRASVTGQIQEIYQQGAILAHYAISQGIHISQWQPILLACVESSRGTTIRSVLRDREAIRFAGVPDSLTEQGNELQRKLQFVLARQQEDIDEDAHQQLSLQQQSVLQEWQQYQQMLKSRYPQYYQSRYQDEPIQLEELQQKLSANEHLLAYFDLDSVLLAVNINEDAMLSKWLDMPGGWQDSLIIYQQMLQKQQDVERQVRLGYFLHEYLWEPLKLPEQSFVKVLADGLLHYFNFETLLTEPSVNQEQNTQLPWLIHKHTVYYGHSLEQQTDLTLRQKGKVLGIAPGFSQQLKAQYLDELSAQQSPDSVFLSWLRTPWSLEFVNQLEAKGWGKALTESAATEQQFLQEASDADILHFGTHALLENEQPLYSFLALTPEPTNGEDGYLQTYELYSQPLQARLAVLTACETGLGAYRQGDGVLSLAHAFRYAGCPSVLYSLWSIDDQQTNEIVSRFYENLRGDMSYAQALRAAKLSYLEEAENAMQAPYYWGGLVLTGDNLSYSSGNDSYFFWLVGLSLVLAGTLIYRKKLRDKRS